MHVIKAIVSIMYSFIKIDNIVKTCLPKIV